MVTVTASDQNGIKNYTYINGNSKTESFKNTYSFSGVKRDISVIVYDNASNATSLICSVIDNTWPDYITPSGKPSTKPKY